MTDFHAAIVGTWTRPEADAYSLRITIKQDGTFTQIVSSKRGSEGNASRLLDVFEGDQYDGNWYYDPQKKIFRINHLRLPKSPLNIRLLGINLPIADWLNQLMDTVRNGEYEVISCSNKEIVLKNSDSGAIEKWER